MRIHLTLLAVVMMFGCSGSKPDNDSGPPAQKTDTSGEKVEKAPKQELTRLPEKVPTEKGTIGSHFVETDKTEAAPIPRSKWNLDYLEKAFGVRFKGFKCIEETRRVRDDDHPEYLIRTYRFLLEFTKDMSENDLALFKMRFASYSPPRPDQIEWAIIDTDGVVVSRTSGSPTFKGEMTGKKGDAFWIVIRDPVSGDARNVQKIEIRSRQKP